MSSGVSLTGDENGSCLKRPKFNRKDKLLQKTMKLFNYVKKDKLLQVSQNIIKWECLKPFLTPYNNNFNYHVFDIVTVQF